MSRDSVLGNIQTERLADIWQGERAQSFREALRNYEFPSGCGSCKWSLDAGNFLDHPIRDFDGSFANNPDPVWPAKLELALSNTCNYACVMCNGSLSSVIRAKEGLPALPHVYGDAFFEDFAPYLAHAESIAFLGGEPFLQAECFRVFDMLMEQKLSPGCYITTNASQYNARVERVLNNLPVSLIISVDGMTKKTMESIRVNSNYETFMENIERFNAYVHGHSDPYSDKREHQLTLNYCVMKQNWQEVADFYRFANRLKAKASPIIVIHPPAYSVADLPPEEFRAVVAELESHTPEMKRELSAQNRTTWMEMLKELRNHVREDAPTLTQVLEDRRKGNSMSAAWDLLQAGKPEAALEAALEFPSTHPYYFGPLALIAQIRTVLGDFEGAEQAAVEATTRFARRPEGHIAMARLRYHQGRIDEGLAALALAEQALERMDRTVDPAGQVIVTEQLLLVGASLRAGAGEAEEALASVENLLAEKPDHAEAAKLRETILDGISSR